MEEDKNKSILEKIVTKLSILAVFGGSLAAINQYVGYSFLNGRLQGIGLLAPEVKLSSYEASYQTMLAIFKFSESWNTQIAVMFGSGWPQLALLSITGGFYIFIFRDWLKKAPTKSCSEKSKPETDDITWKLKTKILLTKLFGYPLVSCALVLFILVSISLLLKIVWGMLSLSYSVGIEFGKKEVSQLVCTPIDNAKDKSGRVAGCSRFKDSYGNILEGRIIHLTKNFTAIITNTESILLNEKNEHIACSPIYDLSKTEEQHKNNKCFLNANIDNTDVDLNQKSL